MEQAISYVLKKGPSLVAQRLLGHERASSPARDAVGSSEERDELKGFAMKQEGLTTCTGRS